MVSKSFRIIDLLYDIWSHLINQYVSVFRSAFVLFSLKLLFPQWLVVRLASSRTDSTTSRLRVSMLKLGVPILGLTCNWKIKDNFISVVRWETVFFNPLWLYCVFELFDSISAWSFCWFDFIAVTATLDTAKFSLFRDRCFWTKAVTRRHILIQLVFLVIWNLFSVWKLILACISKAELRLLHSDHWKLLYRLSFSKLWSCGFGKAYEKFLCCDNFSVVRKYKASKFEERHIGVAIFSVWSVQSKMHEIFWLKTCNLANLRFWKTEHLKPIAI